LSPLKGEPAPMEEEKLEKPEAPGAAEPAPAATGGDPAAPQASESAPASQGSAPDTPGAVQPAPAAAAEAPEPAGAASAAEADVPGAPASPAAGTEAAKPAAAAAPAPAPRRAPPRPAGPAKTPAAAKKSGPRTPIDPTGRGGTATIFAGVAIIAPVLIRELTSGSDPFLLLPITLILLAVALGGLRVAQAGKDGKLGRIGFLLASAGCLVLAIMLIVIAYNDFVLNTRMQSGEFLIDVGFYLLVAGLILFGAAALKAGALARGPMLLMVVSLPLGALLDLVGAFGEDREFQWGPGLSLGPGLHLGLKIMGLALIWMGYSILKTTKVQAEAKTG